MFTYSVDLLFGEDAVELDDLALEMELVLVDLEAGRGVGGDLVGLGGDDEVAGC